MHPNAFLHYRRDSELSTGYSRTLLALSIIFPVLATLALVSRFYSRHLKGVRLGVDDYLLVVSLTFFLYFAVENIVSVLSYGLGSSMRSLHPDQIKMLLKFSAFDQLAYGFTMGFVRWSICALLIRVFITETFRRIVYAIITVNVAQILFNTLAVTLRCIPFANNWSPDQQND